MESVRLRDPALTVEQMNGKGKAVDAGKADPQRSEHLASGACDPVLSSDGSELPCGMTGSVLQTEEGARLRQTEWTTGPDTVKV